MDKKIKHPGGRPVKLTETVIEAILENIRKGLTLKAACKGAGVSYSTLAAWVYRGKVSRKNDIENKYTSLMDIIKNATRKVWIENRKTFFFNLKPRDFRYGWKNPMSWESRRKISDFWKKNREKRQARASW